MVRNRKVGEKMSIAKTGAIPNSYRQVHIAVDDFEKRMKAKMVALLFTACQKWCLC